MLLKVLLSFKMGQDTLQCPHFLHPAPGVGVLGPADSFLNPPTSICKFLDCLLPIWILSPRALASSFLASSFLASSFLANNFLHSLTHLCMGGLAVLYVKISLALSSGLLLSLLS